MTIQFNDNDQLLNVQISEKGITISIDCLEDNGIDFAESRIVNLNTNESIELCKYLAERINLLKNE